SPPRRRTFFALMQQLQLPPTRCRNVFESLSQRRRGQHQVVKLLAIESQKHARLTRLRRGGSRNVREKGNLSKEIAILQHGNLPRRCSSSVLQNLHCS